MEIVTKSYIKVKDYKGGDHLLKLTEYLEGKPDGEYLVHVQYRVCTNRDNSFNTYYELVEEIGGESTLFSSHIISKKGEEIKHVKKRLGDLLGICNKCSYRDQCFSGDLTKACVYTLEQRIDMYCDFNGLSEIDRKAMYEGWNLSLPKELKDLGVKSEGLRA